MTDAQADATPLSQFLESGIEMPTMIRAGGDILTMARKPVEELDVAAIIGLVEADPALTVHLLKLANSSAYGGLGNIKYVRQAVVRLGPLEVLSILSYFVVYKSLPRFQPIGEFNLDACCAHAQACATAARMLGNTDYLVALQPGELYLAGLLHSIGKVVLAAHKAEEFAESMALAAETETPLYQAEQEILGFDHAALGAHLLTNWDLPSFVPAAIRDYNHPELSENKESAGLLQLAVVAANRSGIGFGGMEEDASQCWMLREGKGPLADPNLCEEVMEDIVKAIWKKQSGNDEKKVATKTDTTEKESSPEPVRSEAGLITRIKRLFGVNSSS